MFVMQSLFLEEGLSSDLQFQKLWPIRDQVRHKLGNRVNQVLEYEHESEAGCDDVPILLSYLVWVIRLVISRVSGGKC